MWQSRWVSVFYDWLNVIVVLIILFILPALGCAIYAVIYASVASISESNHTTGATVSVDKDVRCIRVSSTGNAEGQRSINAAIEECSAKGKLPLLVNVDATRGYVICETGNPNPAAAR